MCGIATLCRRMTPCSRPVPTLRWTGPTAAITATASKRPADQPRRMSFARETSRCQNNWNRASVFSTRLNLSNPLRRCIILCGAGKLVSTWSNLPRARDQVLGQRSGSHCRIPHLLPIQRDAYGDQTPHAHHPRQGQTADNDMATRLYAGSDLLANDG
jgi:hypothetical protein